jgi:Ni,Fe-hydrogenase I cytochrome b subunit
MKLKIKIKTNITMYFKANLGAPFIIGFMVLLIICAGFSFYGYSTSANDVAVYAYFFLMIGVILQLASLLKYRKDK